MIPFQDNILIFLNAIFQDCCSLKNVYISIKTKTKLHFEKCEAKQMQKGLINGMGAGKMKTRKKLN